MTVRTLLKSWATPPVSCPIASIFCGLTQPFLGLVLLGQVGGRSAITHEATVGGEDRPAVDADMALPPGRVAARVLEIPERLVPLQRRHMLTPFLRLGLVVGRRIEAAFADQRRPDRCRRRSAAPRCR